MIDGGAVMDRDDVHESDPMLPYLDRVLTVLDEAVEQRNDLLTGSLLMSVLLSATLRLAMGGASTDVMRREFAKAIAEGERRVGVGETRQ